ncbi:recombinase family protein [Amylibacter sp.]|nr:recombinase family protein [Amylibacter sp.]
MLRQLLERKTRSHNPYTEIDSGSKENSIELSKAKECCEKHNATLIVSKVDRLSRDLHQLSGYMKDKKLDFRVASPLNSDKPMLYFYGIIAEMERNFISERTKETLASSKARGDKPGRARPNQKARHDAVKKDADDLAKTVKPVIKAMRDSGNTWDQIAMHMNELSIPTARGGKCHGKTVLNANQSLT